MCTRGFRERKARAQGKERKGKRGELGGSLGPAGGRFTFPGLSPVRRQAERKREKCWEKASNWAKG